MERNVTYTDFQATRQVMDALSHLLRAREYAQNVGIDPWQFAVEWKSLAKHGLERTDVRWLVARRLVDFKREISIAAAFHRDFITHDLPRLSPDTSFILTDAGLAFCQSLSDAVGSVGQQHSSSDSHAAAHFAVNEPKSQPGMVTMKPNWDSNRRELTFKGKLVKSYRVPSRNQELILSAFQEEDWPAFVHDPLPPVDDIEPHRRLQGTIKSLNRKQIHKLIRFRGNGGMKVFWETVT